MKHTNRNRTDLLSVCGQLNEDDAVDPRDFFRKRNSGNNAKTFQLCSQVAETLSLLLTGECSDEILQALQVVSVRPASNSGNLVVFVSPATDILLLTNPVDILQRLNGVTAFLRREVSKTISRRRTPQLSFQVLWPEEKQGDVPENR